MPIYEYSCKKCGYAFETFRGIHSNQEQVECPKCGEKHSERIYSIYNNINSINNDSCAPHFSGG